MKRTGVGVFLFSCCACSPVLMMFCSLVILVRPPVPKSVFCPPLLAWSVWSSHLPSSSSRLTPCLLVVWSLSYMSLLSSRSSGDLFCWCCCWNSKVHFFWWNFVEEAFERGRPDAPPETKSTPKVKKLRPKGAKEPEENAPSKEARYPRIEEEMDQSSNLTEVSAVSHGRFYWFTIIDCFNSILQFLCFAACWDRIRRLGQAHLPEGSLVMAAIREVSEEVPVWVKGWKHGAEM